MKNLFLPIFLLLFAVSAQAQFDAGFDFRSTQAYVSGDHSTACQNTTTANTCWITDTDFPTSTTVNGLSAFNAGWDGTITGFANRNAGVDLRLAGIAYTDNAGVDSFKITLPATGDYCIHVALGDNNGGTPFNQKLEVFDNTTSRFVVTGTNTDGSYFDANNNQYTAANWPASETGKTATFATTSFLATLGGYGGGDFSTLAHLRVVQGACGGGGATASELAGPTKLAGPTSIK